MRGVSLLRATVATALLGHWIANSLFDRDQYAGGGPEVLSRLDDPILVQTGLALIAITLLTLWDRRQGSLLAGLGRLQLVGSLVAAQLVLFVSMEATERLAIDALSAEPLDVGVFGAGFLAEFVVAVGSALLLAALGAATKRILRLLRSREVAVDAAPSQPVVVVGFGPLPRALAGAGGVRAPPS